MFANVRKTFLNARGSHGVTWRGCAASGPEATIWCYATGLVRSSQSGLLFLRFCSCQDMPSIHWIGVNIVSTTQHVFVFLLPAGCCFRLWAAATGRRIVHGNHLWIAEPRTLKDPKRDVQQRLKQRISACRIAISRCVSRMLMRFAFIPHVHRLDLIFTRGLCQC